jgi:hypothetical protein
MTMVHHARSLASKDVVPQAVRLDDGAHFPVCDLPLHKWDQAKIDQVDAAPAGACGDHAAEAAGASVGVEVATTGIPVFLAP